MTKSIDEIILEFKNRRSRIRQIIANLEHEDKMLVGKLLYDLAEYQNNQDPGSLDFRSQQHGPLD
jgi:hypothetical protein